MGSGGTLGRILRLVLAFIDATEAALMRLCPAYGSM